MMSQSKSVFSVKEALEVALLGKISESSNAATIKDDGEPTDMLVIGAGLARTGTTALKIALQRLGLKCYHMKNAVMMDTDLWHEHYLERNKGNPGTYPKIIDEMARQGYTATVDNPNSRYYQELMARYPNAKVILSIRPGGRGGESYATSVLNSIAKFGPMLNQRLLCKWLPTIRKVRDIHNWHFAEHNHPVDKSTFMPQFQDLASSYDQWIQNVQATVPSEKLLVFSPTDGWEPLCSHLAPLDSIIERNCQEILENKEPYPRMNEGEAMRAVQSALNLILVAVEIVPVLIILYLLRSIVKRRKKQKNGEARHTTKSKHQ